MSSPWNIANSWYQKAQNEEDDFDRFVYLWFSFNALYGQFLEIEKSEKSAIISFLNKAFAVLNKQDVTHLLNGQSSGFFKKRVIRNCKNAGSDTSEYAQKLGSSDNSLKYRMGSLALILYQVRCNLFHGDKMFESDTDQKVMKNAADALNELMKIVINARR